MDGNDYEPAPGAGEAGTSAEPSEGSDGSARPDSSDRDDRAPAAAPAPAADAAQAPSTTLPATASTPADGVPGHPATAGTDDAAATPPGDDSATTASGIGTAPATSAGTTGEGSTDRAATPGRADAPTAAPGPPAYGRTRAEPPKILDLPDEENPGRSNGREGTLVLGGAAAAEGRTTGPNPRIAGPARTTGEADASSTPAEERGRHFAAAARRGLEWWPVAAAAVPIVALALLVGGWAIDTAALSGQVMRNVEVAGRSVGGLGEASLPDVMEEINDELAARPVVVTSGDRRLETTAGDIGLAVDTDATADAALAAGRSDALVTRPVTWLASFFNPRDVDVRYSVKESQVVAKVLELQGAELRSPRDPTIQLGDDGWVAVPGTPGKGVDTDEIVAELPEAADASPSGPIEIEASVIDVAPRFSDAEAETLAQQANQMTAEGMTLTAGDGSAQVGAEQLRTWIAPTTANGTLELVILPDMVNAALPELFADLASEPVDATFDLRAGTPVVVPSEQGITCCTGDSPALVWDALTSGRITAELEVVVTEPHVTTEMAEDLGIVQAVGGNNAWRDGAPTSAGPGFTTYHASGQSRVTNIHRIADLVRGTVILPGETFSVNDHVGPRTAEKGFVPAGAIRDGEHVDEIGGGVSQFASTLFNAAYFAGLDIPVSQAHSEYFPRYPRGREATLGHPAPDLQITNDTPYGVMIWTSYTDSSVTVTVYSTPYATAEQTGISESPAGACTVVTTTRTRTYPDGHTANDTFRASYRPGEGQPC